MPPQEKLSAANGRVLGDISSKDTSPESGLSASASSETGFPAAKSDRKSDDQEDDPEQPKDLDFDDLLPHIGEFGTYQRILFVLMIPFAFFVAWVYFSQIFITLVPEKHWCRVPELENLTVEESEDEKPYINNFFVANMSIALFFTFAACILPWIAYFLANWRMTCIAISVPLVLAVAAPWLVPESARWLVSQGQVEKAIEILGKFERMNGTKVPDNVYQQFRETCARVCKEQEADKTYSVVDLFKSPRLRNITILLILIWMAISLVFDGHVRNVNNLGLDVFMTFTIAAFTELPADTFLTLVLDRWGRRWLACGTMVISGIFSIWASAVSNNIYSATLAIVGRFWVNISYNIGLQYAAEVLPTVVRAQGVALIHIMGYVASILAPFVVYLDIVSPVLPLLVLGIMGILGGLLTLLLPETLDKDLPQTLQDGEDFGRDQKMWDMPFLSKKKPADVEVPPVAIFRSFERSSLRSSMRASTRGETLRSSMIQRSSIRSRKSVNAATEAESK